MSDWRESAKQRVKERQEGGAIKLVDGANCMRVLPDKKDIMPDGTVNPKGLSHSPVREVRLHRDVGPDKKYNIRCGHEVDGTGSCWLCDVKIPELENFNSPSKRMQAQAMAPKDQLVVNASRFDPDTNKFTTAKPWWMGLNGGQSLGVRILARVAGSGISKKDFVSPTKGYNLNIERTGTGLNTKYPEIEPDESPSVVPKSILLGMKDLDSVVQQYDAEDQKAAYYGRDREEESSSGRGDRKRKPAPVEEETEAGTEETEEPLEEAEAEETETETEAEVEEDAEPLEDAEESLEDDIPEEYEAEEPEEEPAPPPKKKPAPAPVKKAAPPPARKVAPPPAKRR